MILPTSVILKAYPTLTPDRYATGTTCSTLKPAQVGCEVCPAFSGNSVVGCKCSFDRYSNPDFDLQFKLFFDEYPEYAI